MINTILGTKIKMSQAYEGNKRVPVTLIEAGPCVVTKINDEKRDGYRSVQIGFGEKKVKRVTKPVQGHLKKVIKNKKAPRVLKEIRIDEKEERLKVGDQIKVSDIFSEGDSVTVTGVSKGKGFSGVMRRHGFAGGPRTHGQSDRQRAPGSIGQGTDPGRVRKGKKMAGRMGNQRTPISNLKIVSIDPEKNILAVSGPVAGANNGLLEISLIKKAEKKEEGDK